MLVLRFAVCAPFVLSLYSAPSHPAFADDNPGGANRETIWVTSHPYSSLSPSAEEIARRLARVPGGTASVAFDAFEDSRAVTPQDMLGLVPGVYSQAKFGEDSRLSIRGSGLSRTFQLRGVRLLIDGVPVNIADGEGDFQEIDPTALKYAEVYKGANALRYGAATPGGAINFATATGRDLQGVRSRFEGGSFGFMRAQSSVGVAGQSWDGFVTASVLAQDGYRDHAEQESIRFNANIGHRWNETAETRLFLSLNDIEQDIPGSLPLAVALSDPTRPKASNLAKDYARDIESARLAVKHAIALGGDGQASFGAFYVARQLDHPVYQVIDNAIRDFGGFARFERSANLFGLASELTLGAEIHNGQSANKRFLNIAGEKGAPTADTLEKSQNYLLYGEARLQASERLEAIMGAQFVHATRRAIDRFLTDGDDSGRKSYTYLSPKLGVLWSGESWQAFANLSRAAEAPTFSELNPTADPGFAPLDAERSVSAEIGARGVRGGVKWDISLYRIWLRDELQMFTLPDGETEALNADRTLHQGVELGLSARLAEGLLIDGGAPDTLSLDMAYAYNHFRFVGDAAFGDNWIPGAPHHHLRAALTYTHPTGLALRPNVEWAPAGLWADNANTIKTKGFVVFGARASLDLDKVTLFADARNLFGKRYVSNVNALPLASPNATLFNPGDGFGLFGGITVNW